VLQKTLYIIKTAHTYLIFLTNEGCHVGVAPTKSNATGSTQFAQQAANQTHTRTQTHADISYVSLVMQHELTGSDMQQGS
jgi:hypothetical protein